MVGSSLAPKWPIPVPLWEMDHQKSNFSLISYTLSVKGCWGQPLLLFWKLVDEIQNLIPCEPTMRHNSIKLLILQPVRADLLCTLQCEIPCTRWFLLNMIGFFDCIFSVNWLANSPSKIMIYNLQLKQKKLDWKFHVKHLPYPPVLLNFEKSSLKLSSKIKSISNLIFAACAACKNQVWNRLKIKFVQLDFWKKF